MAQLLKEKKEALQQLQGCLTKGEAILAKIKTIQNLAHYNTLVEEQDSWHQETSSILNHLFDTKDIANNFDGYNPSLPADNFRDNVNEFESDMFEEITQLKTVIDQIKQDFYKSPDMPKRWGYEWMIKQLKENTVVAILLLTFAVLIGIFELINKGSESLEHLHGKEPKVKGLIWLDDMAIIAAFQKHDGSYQPVKDDSLAIMLGDRRTIDTTANGHKTFHLVFLLTDGQFNAYKSFRFHFSASFYAKLGGNKDELDGWTAPDSGNYREYIIKQWDKKLDFKIEYDKP
jgi:hypothetical protein